VEFLDFIKNRLTSQQQPVANKSQEQKPETAQQMYKREAVEEKASRNPIGRMPPEQIAKLNGIKATLERATRHINKDVHAPSAAPGESAGGWEAMQQNMTAQDKTAPALSPASMQAGKSEPDRDTPNAPEKSVERPQTLPRPRPSWER
jgi:hypothetical protein